MVTNNIFLNHSDCKYTPFSNQNKIFSSLFLFYVDFETFTYITFNISLSQNFLNGIKTF